MPAFILHTASIAGASVLDLESSVGKFESRSFINRLNAAIVAGNVDKVAIFSHHKTHNSLQELVGKIDAAIGLNAKAPQHLRAFIQEFNPRGSPSTYPLEVLHNFCEECRNLADEVGQKFTRLKAESEIMSTPWWQKEGVKFEETLRTLSNVRFSDNLSESPAEIASKLHDLLGPIYSLGLPEFKPKEVSGFLYSESIEINRSLTGYRNLTDGLRESLIKYSAGEFRIDDFLRQSQEAQYFGAREAHFCGRDGEVQIPIKDSDRQIKNLLRDLLRTFKAQAEALDSMEAGASFSASFVTERYRQYELEELTQKLSKINCGAYVHVTFSQNQANWDEIFAKNAPALAELIKSGNGIFIPMNASGGEDSRGFFEVYIKASERSIDFEAERQARAVKDKDGHYVIERSVLQIDVWEDLGAAKNIVALCRKPDVNADYPRSFIVYEHQDQVIVAYGSSHMQAALHIAHYLSHKGYLEAELSGYSFESQYRTIYDDAGRATIGYDKANCDFTKEDPKGAKFIAALIELGVPAESIEYDGYLASGKMSRY